MICITSEYELDLKHIQLGVCFNFCKIVMYVVGGIV